MARAWILWAAVAAGCSGGEGSCPNDLPASCPTDAAGYAATIAPLLADRCVACHSPGGTSTHYLQTYADVSNLAGPVLDQVYACRMPPAGYPALTDTERQALLGWLVCGAPDN
jgi:uncharacterized membrane protein